MSGGGSTAKEARRAKQAEEAREQRIRLGTADIRNKFGAAFSPTYYNELESKANELYQPQVQDQYLQGIRQLQAALARTGLLDSSVYTRQRGLADKQKLLADTNVQSTIRGQIQQRKQDVAGAEAQAVGQLQSSGDPAAAAQQAANLIQINTKQPAWSPLGQIFTDFTAGLATQGELEREGNARYDLGISRLGNTLQRYAQRTVRG